MSHNKGRLGRQKGEVDNMSKAYIPLRIEKYQLKDEEVLEVLCIGEKSCINISKIKKYPLKWNF